MHYRPEIDGLRAIAISSVVLFHAGGFVPGGYAGVDVFFVISGFLITSLILSDWARDKFSFANFYARRARRILPAFFFMITVVTAVCLVVMLPQHLKQYGKLIIYTVLFGSNFRLVGEPNYFDDSMRDTPLLHMWSLSVEEQYYLIWPLLLFLLFRSPWRRHTAKIIFSLFALSLAASAVLVEVWPRSAFYHLPSRGWELLLGAIIAFGFVPRIGSRILAEVMSAGGLFLILISFFIYNKDTRFPGAAALLPTVGCALVIHATTSFDTFAKRLLRLPPVTFIGKISYSLYLWHWPFIAIPAYLMLRELTGAEAAIAMVAAILVSIVSWRFVERPFRKGMGEGRITFGADLALAWWRAVMSRLKAVALALNRSAYSALCLAAVLIASGSYMQESKGIRWRLSPEALVYADSNGAKAGYRHDTLCKEEKIILTKLHECRFGNEDQDARPVVVWGDSHADHYLPVIAEIFGAGHLFMTPACIPVAGVMQVDTARRETIRGCSQNNMEVLQEIIKLKPKLVVLGGKWDLVEGFNIGYGPSHGLYYTPIQNSDQSSRDHFSEAFENTIKVLTDLEADVLIMDQVPEYSRDVVKCKAFSLYLGLDEASCARRVRSDTDRANKPMRALFREIAITNPRVRFYSPLEELCDQEFCFATRNGKMLYTDDHHINFEGAKLLTRSIDKLIASFPHPNRAALLHAIQ
jgi:peptidoglycan/LPS O-acetylase OafA/YrhL